MNNHRFKDRNFGIYTFSDIILVHCPTCRSKAEVNHEHGVLSCSSCKHYQERESTSYRLEVKRNCPQCGKHFEFSIDKVVTQKASIRLACKHCNFNHDYKPKYIDVSLEKYWQMPYAYTQKTEGTDSLFNADLWLRKRFKNHLFWAHNYEHLAYIKAFVQAKIRERNDNLRMSMIAKLPAFIKAKKNREDLLRVIASLENKQQDKT